MFQHIQFLRDRCIRNLGAARGDVTLHCRPADCSEFTSEERLEVIFDYPTFAFVVRYGDAMPLMRRIMLSDLGEGLRAGGTHAVGLAVSSRDT